MPTNYGENMFPDIFKNVPHDNGLHGRQPTESATDALLRELIQEVKALRGDLAIERWREGRGQPVPIIPIEPSN